VKHLRFLAVVEFLGALLVACPLLALYFVPLGISLEGVQGVSWWVAPLLPLALLVSACLWVALSYAGLMPSTLTPWATSSSTLWIDKCCVDQENIRGFLDGGLRNFVLSSDRMIAFLGPKYCTRLWCVYELATFCKEHKHNLSQRLLLLSIDWEPLHSPFKDPELTDEERDAFRSFHCRDAHCFKPADRAYVLQAIRNEWGSVEAFDHYVQTQLPEILAASKQAYSQRFVRLLQSNLEHMFGD